MASYALHGWGYHTYRGSSSRGAVGGLIGLIGHVRAGGDDAVTVDGPRGPLHEPKPGIFAICRKSGAALVPMAASCPKGWRLRSWDRYLIPRPFTRYIVRFAPPLPVESDDNRNIARLREALFMLAPDG